MTVHDSVMIRQAVMFDLLSATCHMGSINDQKKSKPCLTLYMGLFIYLYTREV